MSTVVLSDSNVVSVIKAGLLDNTVVVKEASQLIGYDPLKVYFIDGLIDMTGVPIEVGMQGFTAISDDYNRKGLFANDTSGALFVNKAGEYAGDINLSKMSISTNPNCSVFDLDNQNNFSEISLDTVNLGAFGAVKSKLGTLSNYRQVLANNVGMFNLDDGLVLNGSWSGFKITNLIGLLLGDITLFQAGAGFDTDDFRFISNKVVSVGDNFALADFTPANINNTDGMQVKLNEFKTIDMFPNLPYSDVKAFYVENAGIRNTYVGGKERITTPVETTITTVNEKVMLAGGATYYDLQHFSDGGGNNTLTYIGNGAIKEFLARVEATIQGTANRDLELFIRRWNNSLSVYEEVDSRIKRVENVQGNTDVAYFNFEESIVLNQNDRVEMWIANTTDSNNVTALADSTITVYER